MKRINELINILFKKVRKKSPENLDPISFESQSEYDSDEMGKIIFEIKRISSYENKMKIHFKEKFIQSKIDSINYTIKIKNQIPTKEGFSNAISSILEIDISDLEINIIEANPEEFIRNTLIPVNETQLEYYIQGMKKMCNIYYSTNTHYKNNPREFIYAVDLIQRQRNELESPISFISNNYDELKLFYSSKNINLNLENNYNLILINDSFEFGKVSPSRIYDKKNKRTIFLNGIEYYVLIYIIELKSKFEFDLLLKPSAFFFIEGISEIKIIVEHLEVGKYFKKSNLDNVLISKLYTNNYDTLWINIDGKNITFEEILNEIEVYEDTIITQVIHCEYFEESGDYFIGHIDHEYIFYSIEEYEQRKSDPMQKGNIRKRIKTFKIDNGRIPIDASGNIFLNFLEMKFEQKELLNEYFNTL